MGMTFGKGALVLGSGAFLRVELFSGCKYAMQRAQTLLWLMVTPCCLLQWSPLLWRFLCAVEP